LALTNAQMQAMQEAEDIDTGVDTRTKEERTKEQMDALKSLGRTIKEEGPMFLAESAPGFGEAIAIKRTSDALDEGDYVGAGIEATAGFFGLFPGLGDAAGRGLRAITRKLRKDAKLTVDNPGFDKVYQETYAESKQKSADAAKKRAVKSGQKDTYAVNLGNDEGVTGYANKVTFKPEELKDLPGAMGEEKFRSSGEKLERLKKSIAKEGYKPENNTILIHVREDGQPFVVEGNTRLAEALESGRETINADIRYLRGAEEKTGPLDPRNIFPDQIKEADALEIGINPATKDGALLKKYNISTSKNIVENSSAATAGTKEANKLINAKVADGTKVGIRLNLNSTIPNMPKGLDKLQTLHKNNYNGKALSYKPFATVEDVTFNVSQKGRQGIAAKIKRIDVPEAKNKFPAMSVDGKYNNTRNVLDEIDDDVVEIGFNPVSGHLFIDLSTGQAVKSADVATVIGDRVYAKGVTYMKKAEAPNPLSASDGTPLPSEVRYKMKKGGTVMDRQMSMFDDGGLMDEGGTVDPVSGNDVPPGSTQEEVRDDIPAQLSEGEFVFPADVVRYIGLGNLMRMRQEAKMGLKMMEEMGQMGNSEEATMPDDLPFDINDLDMEDEPEYNVGGYVPPITAATQQQEQMGISGFQQAAAPTTGVAAVPQQAASQQYVQPVQPVQAAVPTMQAYKPSEVPTFQQTIGDDAFGTYDELRQYRNETGNIINVPFRNGQPISPIPEGYTFVDPEETATEEVTTTPTTPQTTQVREEGGNDEARQRREEEMYGPGGGRVGVDGKIYGVSFDMPEGFMPGMGASISTALSLATGEPLPEGVTVNFKRDDVEFSMTSEEYNDFKSTARKFGYNSKEASQKLNELGREEAEKEAKIAQQIEKARKVEDNMARAAQKIEDKKERDAALLEVAKRREERSIYGTGGDDTGTKGQGYSVGSKTDKGSGATDRGFGGTGRGRSDAPGMAAADVRSGSSYGTSPPEGPMGSISGRPRAKGGLMEAPKSKAKKMKRGGLASKK